MESHHDEPDARCISPFALLALQGFSARELKKGAEAVRALVLSTLRVLTKVPVVQAALGDAAVDASDEALLDMTDVEAPEQLATLRELVVAHWRTDGVAAVLEALRTSSDSAAYLGSNEWIQFWLDEAGRVLSPGYVPTDEDMLKLRRPTSGAMELPFTMGGSDFVLVDVGGQTHEMRTWMHELDKNVQGVIMFVSLADFDKTGGAALGSALGDRSAGGKTQKPSELAAGFCMLNEVLLATPALEKIPIVVVLNKMDLFDQRIRSKASKFYKFFADCPKDVARKPKAARLWLADRITNHSDFFPAPHAEMACFCTCATDTSMAETMIDNVINAVLGQLVMDAGF